MVIQPKSGGREKNTHTYRKKEIKLTARRIAKKKNNCGDDDSGGGGGGGGNSRGNRH